MDSNMVLAIITATGIIIASIISSIGIFYSAKQLKETNKQFLFDKRLNALSVAKMLIESFKDGGTINMDSNEENPFNKFLVRYALNYTNNLFLKDIQSIITLDPNKDISDEERQKYLIKFTEMRVLSDELKLIYNKSDELLYIADFIFKYQKFLFSIIKSSIFKKYINDKSEIGAPGIPFSEVFQNNEEAVKLNDELNILYEELSALVDGIEKNKIIETIESEMLTLS